MNIISPDLWQCCAGPLVNLPAAGTYVVYFPQGHIEQVAASEMKSVNAQIPSYPKLQSRLLCILHNVALHVDHETDEIYAQMTLQPVPKFDKEALLRSDLSMKVHKPQTEFFRKTLTASDTSTIFYLPRESAEKIFPPLDYSLKSPVQELVARDLHDRVWTFRHIFCGQPKRHLLTTGWSLFVNGKRLSAGDSVFFIKDKNQQLIVGIRRATTQPANISSSVLTRDSMHIAVLADAAYAASNNSSFTVFYNPRTSPSEFVIPLAKYWNTRHSNQLSPRMRFCMTFESEDSGTKSCIGTITGINDLDGLRWKNSQWRNIQVVWDKSNDGQRRTRVSFWEITPITTPFIICPTPFYGFQHLRQPVIGDNESAVQWINMQQNLLQPNNLSPLPRPVMQNFGGPQIHAHESFQFNCQRSATQLDYLQKLPVPSTTMHPQQQMSGLRPLTIRQNVNNKSLPENRFHQVQPQNILQQQFAVQNHQQQKFSQFQNLQKGVLQPQVSDQQQFSQPLQVHENRLQLLQKLHQQQQSLSVHQSAHLQAEHKPLANVSENLSNQMMKKPRFNSQTNIVVSHNSQQLMLHHQAPTNHFSTSCSTLPSSNNSPVMLPSMTDSSRPYKSTKTSGEEITHTSGLENEQKPSVNIVESQRKGSLTPQTVSQLDEPGTSTPSETNRESHLGMILDHLPIKKRKMGSHNDFQNNQQELSLSLVPDMTFNSIDSTKNGSSLLNTGVLSPPPLPLQLFSTYIKVYRQGAVGRSIDISAYSSYMELINDIDRQFGKEEKFEDWELVYVDHENDVLLIGDEPWKEFVNCVRSIKILSPQEVQQMSSGGDFSRREQCPP